MFFDEYATFSESIGTASSLNRLNLRHQAIIEANRHILKGARVLDLASHDGRWSFAALQAGAKHVTGVEARCVLVATANEIFAENDVDTKTYTFIHDDLFAALHEQNFDVDVVLCLGFLYHTLRYPELFKGIRNANPAHLVIDTKVAGGADANIELKVNRTGVQSNAAKDEVSHRRRTVAGWPSVPALQLMLDVYEFDIVDEFDWPSLLASHPEIPPRAVHDYQTGNRVTLHCHTRNEDAPP